MIKIKSGYTAANVCSVGLKEGEIGYLKMRIDGGPCGWVAWQGFGSGGATRVASLRRCQELPPCPAEPVAACKDRASFQCVKVHFKETGPSISMD